MGEESRISTSTRLLYIPPEHPQQPISNRPAMIFCIFSPCGPILKKQNHQVNKMTLLLAIKYRNIFPAQPWMKTANPCPIRNFFLIPSPHALFFFNLDL